MWKLSKDAMFALTIAFLASVIIIYGFYMPTRQLEHCDNFLCFNLIGE